MTYLDEASKPRSEKITLATIESVERLKLFNSSGANWIRKMNYFVVGVKDNGVSIASWSYTPTTGILTILGGTNPKTRNISVTYRHFFSNAPIILPYDLSSGETLEWESRILSIGSIGQQLDSENTGIVLESSSSIDLENTDGFFDPFFDTHIWENQNIKFYSWFSSIAIAERVQLFEGVIESKSFTDKRISFKVKDFVYKLKDKVNLGLFSESDGIILPSLLGTAKRRIYGKAEHVKCVGLDSTLDGFLITGTISCAVGTNTVTGIGTQFVDQLSPNDELIFEIDGATKKIAIESIASNTILTIGRINDFNINNLTPKVKPAVPSRYKNRAWHVAHHELRSPIATITSVISNNRLAVNTSIDMVAGDSVLIGGAAYIIRRISGSVIVTESAVSPLPAISDTITRLPISAVFYRDKRLAYTRDYSIINTTESKIVLTNLAEFHNYEEVRSLTSYVFTNGSTSVTTSATLDLRTILKPRDWIRSATISETNWYEVLEVKAGEIILRSAFVGTSGTKNLYYKNVEYIDDESLITVHCIGKKNELGQWIKTASDAVRDLIIFDAGFGSVNETSFAKAKADCDYTLSLVIPDDIGKGYPIIRDELTKINNSVFGALYGDSSQAISYSIFNAQKPESILPIRDDDILSFSVESSQRIINSAKISYRPYVDVFSGEPTFKVVVHDSSFVDNLIGIKSTQEAIVYLFDDEAAEIYAQRLTFFRSLSNSIVKLKTKMNLAQTVVGDKLYLSLDRLYERYAGGVQSRIGVVSGIKKDGFGCEISLSDLGNIYNRVMSIAPNSTLDYSTASDDDKMKWCFIVDNDTGTPSATSEEGLGSYLIG
jgi:hypothetical protein